MRMERTRITTTHTCRPTRLSVRVVDARSTILATDPSSFGLDSALRGGGVLSLIVFGILLLMSITSFYILFSKFFDQQIIVMDGKRVRHGFWSSGSLREGTAKLNNGSSYRQLADAGLSALDQHVRLSDQIKAVDWVRVSLVRAEAAVNSRLGGGLAFLATVGATAPFIGLFGTVIGIHHALVKIGSARQVSIDAVAGPVGEALIMTAVGLVVAVPAVLAYNWLQRRNQAIAADLNAFSNELLGYLASGGAIRPRASCT